MVNLTDLKKAASALAEAFPLSTRAYSAGKLYEAWLMLELGLTLRRFGWEATWIDPSKTLPSTMRFRGGPSHLYNHILPAPGYLRLTKGQKRFEMHNSVRFMGFSRTLHEVDISVIKETDASVCRQHKIDPRGLPELALELKHYTDDISLGLIRSTLLASIDLAQAYSLRQSLGRSAQLSDDGTKVKLGNLDASLVRIITTSERVGKSNKLARFFGAHVIPGMIIQSTHVPGCHAGLDRLCEQFDAMFS